eukprot:1283222-Rhodomonas_salina.3
MARKPAGRWPAALASPPPSPPPSLLAKANRQVSTLVGRRARVVGMREYPDGSAYSVSLLLEPARW